MPVTIPDCAAGGAARFAGGSADAVGASDAKLTEAIGGRDGEVTGVATEANDGKVV